MVRALARRVTEATPQQLVATGATWGGSGGGIDPIDGDTGYRLAGSRGRPIPPWTLERARASSVAAYRSNPMGRAVVDTYLAFALGDKGISYTATNPQVQAVVDEFWNDPRNALGGPVQSLLLRDMMLYGESLIEMLVGAQSGVVRFSPMDITAISRISYVQNNVLWPENVFMNVLGGAEMPYSVVAVDDSTGLRAGEAQFWAPWKTLVTDDHSMPFLMPILDWLDSYDTVLSNLIDHTALRRYFVWDVTVEGDQAAVDRFVNGRGGLHAPPSGSVEVHNQGVTWKAQSAPTGAEEDTITASAVLTLIAGGTGLAKHWLAEPEHTNRATGMTMAEPVRRRVQGLQRTWLGYMTELVRFAVDRAVAARRLPQMVTATDPRTGQSYEIPASQCVTVTGPEIAAADSQITAQVMLNLATGLEKMVEIRALTREAASAAARHAWEDYMGVPYSASLDSPNADPDDVATAVDEAVLGRRLRPVAQGARP